MSRMLALVPNHLKNRPYLIEIVLVLKFRKLHPNIMYLTFLTSQRLLTTTKILSRTYINDVLGKKTILKTKAMGSGLSLQGRNLSVCNFTAALLPVLQPNPYTDVSSSSPLQQRRHYRSGRGNRSSKEANDNSQPVKSPQLMDFPWIIWPSIWHTIRNWIFANLIIRPYLDKEFTLSTFKSGAVQALVHVSHELSKGNFNGLEGFVTKPSLEEAKTNFTFLSLKERLDLAVVAEDIFFCFPYQIGVMFTNEGGPKDRIFVEVTMCYHVFRGFQDHIKTLSNTNESLGPFKSVFNNYDSISIANYRFIREYTKGVEDEWTVNIVNHFKPAEYNQ